MSEPILLEVRDLSVNFGSGDNAVRAVRNVSFEISRGETLALVGYVRAEFLRGRNFDYVRAARALGMLDVRIMMRHILPNAMTASLTFLPFILAGSVTTLTALDFLGFGLPPGSPSLGELVLQGKNNLNAPWLAFTAFITIASMLSLLVFIGEAVRDAFNPRKVPV